MLLRQIECFQSVVKNKNFYLAADECHISQSAVSQQIKKLEDELGVKLLERHNRTFSLTKAGEHFYQKSLVITEDLTRLIRETKRIGNKSGAVLRFGYYKGYYGNELTNAVSEFSEKYPSVDMQIMSGSHEELYNALENDSVDIVLNDQRRAFSGAYNNIILSESRTYIELSVRNALSRLNKIEPADLKNMPCIIVSNEKSRTEEQRYYEKIVGLKGDFIFVGSVREARMKIVTGQGYMPVDVIGEQKFFDTQVSRIPLVRNSEPVTKIYCAFWKKNNSGYYIEEFADML
ncbi:MAG: LysR family transcriptional regulator, partial [Clostridia bacterium]|nr:LysR family transcriptional regulator [Clostridia bacterium]